MGEILTLRRPVHQASCLVGCGLIGALCPQAHGQRLTSALGYLCSDWILHRAHAVAYTQMKMIKKINWSDRSDNSHVCDVITLSDNSYIYSWNGNASYEVYDKAHGRLEVGAILVKEEEDEAYDGRPFTRYYFE